MEIGTSADITPAAAGRVEQHLLLYAPYSEPQNITKYNKSSKTSSLFYRKKKTNCFIVYFLGQSTITHHRKDTITQKILD